MNCGLEENVQQLVDMGFPCESSIREALKKAHNDVNQAVMILTGEDLMQMDDVEIQEVQKNSEHDNFQMNPLPSPPPSYDDTVPEGVQVLNAILQK